MSVGETDIKLSAIPDKIFYINLDRRQDRNQSVQKLLMKFNLQGITERIGAIDGSKLDLDRISHNIILQKGILDAKDKTQKTGIPLTPGGIGCALSHRIAWQKIIDQKLTSGLILEDDIRIDKDFIEKLKDCMDKVKPLMYDILFIGYHPASIKHILPDSSNNTFVRSSRTYGLFSYVVSRQGAEKLLNIFPINNQIDSAISDAIVSHKLNMYLVKPENRIITSDPSEVATEFGTDIQKRENFVSCNLKSNNLDTFFYHIILFMTSIISIYLIGMFFGLFDQNEK